jgi:hypothetical protein
MKKLKIKQGTRAWENIKEKRIGSSEVFDIVRYYATDTELHNCGVDAKQFREETPFVTTWALYHKIIGDGVYQKPLLEPEYGEYGLAMEQYGLKVLQENRQFKLRKGDVYVNDRLIASLDISGLAEEVDVEKLGGKVKVGDNFVCEEKTITPYKDHLPLKYIIQAQYQISHSNSKFFILLAMILNKDTPFERGKIVSLANTSKKKFLEYVKDKVNVQLIYFNNNEALAQLINVCLERFFKDVEDRKEPKPFIVVDSMSNIMTSIRQNSFYNPDLIKEYDLNEFTICKENFEKAKKAKEDAQQKIIEFAMENNCSRFVGSNGYSAMISSNGRFLLKEPKEVKND